MQTFKRIINGQKQEMYIPKKLWESIQKKQKLQHETKVPKLDAFYFYAVEADPYEYQKVEGTKSGKPVVYEPINKPEAAEKRTRTRANNQLPLVGEESNES